MKIHVEQHCIKLNGSLLSSELSSLLCSVHALLILIYCLFEGTFLHILKPHVITLDAYSFKLNKKNTRKIDSFYLIELEDVFYKLINSLLFFIRLFFICFTVLKKRNHQNFLQIHFLNIYIFQIIKIRSRRSR